MTDHLPEDFEEHPDEQRLAKLMRLMDDHDVPPHVDDFKRIHAESLNAFTQQHAALTSRATHSPQTPRSAMKIAALLSTALLTLLGAWMIGTPSEASALKLGEVFARLDDYEALQLQVTRGNNTANVWVQQPGMIRWEESESRYKIARGSRLWKVDEDTQAADSIDNPWFDQSGNVDLLALLEVSPDERSAFLLQIPSGYKQFAGKECMVYRRLIEKDLRLEVFIDSKTTQLVGITARNPMVPDTQPPLAELSLVAVNPIVDDAKFRVPVKLAEHDRIGKVSDTQGIVTLRPVGSRRWTPICRELLVQPGDWVRTDVRGANAATIVLASGAKLVVGPGSLVEIISMDEARLHSGTIQVTRPKQAPNDFRLLGQGNDEIVLSKPGKVLYQLNRDQKLTLVKGKPVWLAGYEGTSAEDSIGSLIVTIDGRNTPLSVGEHHVTVEIRDQIARTTIEETFVNHTESRMEGTFHFPLPQDASISGFGMWIGNELVEADIVEKQRAREIYETILREKRDPGLLEWTGGNIFKARVFPIEAHSEKRVKIVYTQVLPLRGNRFRYTYGLKSEMLATNPLRDLNVRVLINSAVPLVSAESPTHTCRAQQTEHSAELEFSAQQYSPTKDFEVVCEVNHHENDVMVIPHQRGEDGYFLMQLMPPGNQGNWRREVIPDGDPLEIILLCDTSGSMDSSMRETQQQFVASFLASLGDKDRFTLAACDVGTVWAFDDYVVTNNETLQGVRKFLDQRVSLGWTDLDQAFTEVMKKATANTQIIYVGDGIVSTVDSDPAAFINRLKRSALKETKEENFPTLHAVSVGSSYESIVLKGIASLGGGSMRQISGEITPQQTALELLNEIAQPGLKNVHVEFRGVRVAAVYPEQLPNIAAGTQQILVGRYLPEGKDQHGEVVVTGIQNGKPVTYVARFGLQEAEAGNSFIPRLWARAHLDTLLLSGSNQLIQDEIIALSEEFHIITPYTSLLVLESDADRERFGVKRRFEMRDGERFFADGRDNANYELRQKQMQRAGNWRLGLRREILAHLVGLGRDPSAFQKLEELKRQNVNGISDEMLGTRVYPVSTLLSTLNGRSDWGFQEVEAQLGEDLYFGGFFGGMGGGGSGGGYGGGSFGVDDLYSSLNFSGEIEELGDLVTWDTVTWGTEQSQDSVELQLMVTPGIVQLEDQADLGFDAFTDRDLRQQLAEFETYEGTRGSLRSKRLSDSRGRNQSQKEEPFSFYVPLTDGGKRRNASYEIAGRQYGQELGQRGRRRGASDNTAFMRTLFPSIPFGAGISNKVEEPQSTWPAEAIAISESLLREKALQAFNGGMEMHLTTQVWSSGFDRLIPSSQRAELYSANQRLNRTYGQGHQSIVHWCDDQQRGAYSESLQLGRVRKAETGDLERMPLIAFDDSYPAIHKLYGTYLVNVSHLIEGQVVLTLTNPDDDSAQLRYTIDTTKNVVLKQEHLSDGKVTSSVTHREFIKVAGLWWATKSVSTHQDHPAHVVSVITRTIKEHTPDSFIATWKEETAGREQVQFLNLPAPSLSSAKLRVAADQGTFEDHVLLLLHHAQAQKWDDVFKQLRRIEALAAGKPGMPWVRIAIELQSGRNEDAKQHLIQQLDNLRATEASDLFLAYYTLDSLYNITNWNEFGAAIEQVRPIAERQPDKPVSMLAWNQRWIQVLHNTGRKPEALALQKQIAEELPKDVNLQVQYAGALVAAGRLEDALDFVREQLAKKDHWQPRELNTLRRYYADRFDQLGRSSELLTFLREWFEQETVQSSVFQRYLTALVINDQVVECDQTVASWLTEVKQPGELTSVSQARVEAAISFCLGEGYKLRQYNGIDHKWFPQLYETALLCIPREDRQALADRIVSHSNFSESDEGDRIRGEILNRLLEDVDTIPLGQLMFYTDTLHRGRLLLHEGDHMQVRQVSTEEWTTLAARILKRWEAEENALSKHYFAGILTSIYDAHEQVKYLPFLRRMLAEGPEKYRNAYREELFEALQSQPWTAEIEAELFTMWPTLSEEKDQSIRVIRLVPRLYSLVDRMIQSRISAANRLLQDEGHTDELTRTERQQKRAEFLKAAREGVAERLLQEWNKQEQQQPLLADWIMAEKVYLDMLLDRNQKEVLTWCWQQLGDAPPQYEFDKEFTAEEQEQKSLKSLLRQRAWITVLNLSVRQNASPKFVERVLTYIDTAITQAEQATKQRNADLDEADQIDLALDWKRSKYNFFIAIDRPDELATALKVWIATARWNIPWRRALANLSAERGDIKEAIQILESIEKEDELTPEDYRMLADLYLVQDQRTQYERSRIEIYKAMQEYQISNFIKQKQNQLNQQQGPHELDEETLFALQAIFEKTKNPANYYWQVQSLYTSTLDYRTLAMVPESILGHTRQQVYQSLQKFNSIILQAVRKESTADEMLATLVGWRTRLNNGEVPRGADPNNRSKVLDLRALDLMESMLERQSAKVLNQPGPHAENALAALKRAFKADWAPGEQLQYAVFLTSLGGIANEKNELTLLPLRDEQLRQLKQLFDEAKPATRERIQLGQYYADLIFNHYGRLDEGLLFFKTVIDEMTAAHDGLVPYEFNGSVQFYVSMLERFSRFEEGEKFLQKHLDALTGENQRWTYVVDLNQLHENALHARGRTSLGHGEVLFNNLIARLETLCETNNDQHRYQLLSMINNLFDHVLGNNDGFDDTKDRLLEFANKRLPKLLTSQHQNYEDLIQRFSETIRRRVDSLEALFFLLDRMEDYPVRHQYTYQDPWRQHSWQLAEYRHTASNQMNDKVRLAALEERLLPLVLNHLRSDLMNLREEHRTFYDIDQSYFWSEKAEQFLQTAEDILKERKDSPRTLTHVADYLYEGLHKRDRAIEVLFVAHRRGLLDDGGLDQLIGYLHDQDRYAESIALLEPYMERQPDNMHLRVLLMRAYYYTQRFQQLDELITATDANFHQAGRWHEQHIVAFARVCYETNRKERAVGYFEEAINLHQRTQPNRGIGNGTLSIYYQELSGVYSDLKQTEKAVDAASAAIVSWGRDQNNRQHAMNSLQNVLRQADDLDHYLKTLDANAKKTGQDSPVIRKALGQVFQSKEQWRKAIDQYRLAIELQPTDREVHQALLECFDKLEDNAGAIQQLLAQKDFDRHNLHLYVDLAKRMQADERQAERAATSIVESAPNEAESHEALAKFRTEQKRYQMAIPHWKKVAELRKLEPTGLLGLAEAQAKLKDWKGMRASIQQLQQHEWPERFNTVNERIRELQKSIPQ